MEFHWSVKYVMELRTANVLSQGYYGYLVDVRSFLWDDADLIVNKIRKKSMEFNNIFRNCLI